MRRTHYCGAYWGWGFHEDGVVSALRACERDRAGATRERAPDSTPAERRSGTDEEALAA